MLHPRGSFVCCFGLKERVERTTTFQPLLRAHVGRLNAPGFRLEDLVTMDRHRKIITGAPNAFFHIWMLHAGVNFQPRLLGQCQPVVVVV